VISHPISPAADGHATDGETVEIVAVTLLICNIGGPASTQQAQPIVDKFLRRMESSGGFAAGSLKGVYHTRLSACERYVQSHKPAMVVTDLATYLAMAKKWNLTPLAHMGKADAKRYHVLVREGSYKRLAELKGKKLISTLAPHPQFLSKIVFSKKLDAKNLELEATRKPLRGLRKVALKQADVTVVDELAYRYLAQLKLPSKLVSIHKSRALPGLTMSVTAKAGKTMRKKIIKMLPKLCKGDGKQMCQTFQITAFKKVRASLYKKLSRLYR
jgi:hypothetical protein